MKRKEHNKFTCNNCGSNQAKVRYHLGKWDLLQCKSCKLMVIDPFPSVCDLKAVYNSNYYKNEKLTKKNVLGIYGYSDYIAERINKQIGYKRICNKIRNYIDSDIASPGLLDFGCGLGHFMDVAYDFGYAVHGVEFNKYAIDYIQNRYTYPVLSFPEFNEKHMQFDVITLFDVIEHLRDPFTTIDTFYGSLKDDGVLVISTMDSKSWVSRLMGKRLEDFRRIREHIYFFSRHNLCEMLTKRGFEVLEVRSHGHTFEVKHLVTRLINSFPLLKCPLNMILKIFPFLSSANIYVNPLTKMIIYARKRARVPSENNMVKEGMDAPEHVTYADDVRE